MKPLAVAPVLTSLSVASSLPTAAGSEPWLVRDFPGRPDDVFGIGYYFYNLSDDLQSAIAAALPLDDEQGVEVFNNFALTGWLRLTADLQWINPARARFSDAWIAGLRASVAF